MRATDTSGELDRNLAMEAARVTEAAAMASWRYIGRGDERAADEAAVNAMRAALNDLAIEGRVIIGDGQRDEGPGLFVGEAVGVGVGPAVDVAVDPLEGATLVAKAMPNALAVVAFAGGGAMLAAPAAYMDKIAVGPGYPDQIVDLDETPARNVAALAKAKGVQTSEITVCVLDRPRHADIIASLRSVEARVLLINDGDVAGVINTTDPDTAVDLYLGQGGAPEGVLACAALKCVGGQFQGRLVFRTEDERVKARSLGFADKDFTRKLVLDELIKGEAIFAATGITSGALLDGVRVASGFVNTHTLVMNSSTRSVRSMRTRRPAVRG
jgi:fructose-1,6-bisphosphatase II / sedoheptulose-1,7-bisphosphatase